MAEPLVAPAYSADRELFLSSTREVAQGRTWEDGSSATHSIVEEGGVTDSGRDPPARRVSTNKEACCCRCCCTQEAVLEPHGVLVSYDLCSPSSGGSQQSLP